MLSRYRKTIVAVLGVVATAANIISDAAGDSDPSNDDWAAFGMSVVLALGVYFAKNTRPADKPFDPNISEAGPAPATPPAV